LESRGVQRELQVRQVSGVVIGPAPEVKLM
jgi:hypothetical protein